MSNELPTLPKGLEPNLEIKPKLKTLAEVEKECIQQAISFHSGNKTQAAKSLGITIKTLYNKLHEYGLFDKYKIHNRDIVCPVVEEAKRRGNLK